MYCRESLIATGRKMESTELISITDNISYLPPTRNPLSANVVFIRGESGTWIYDVGASKLAEETINEIEGKKNIVISHFHQDHIANISNIKFDKLYVGGFTKKHLTDGTVVEASVDFPLNLESSIQLKTFCLPSTHAKGCLILQCDDYAFVGDGTYCTEKNGRRLYNPQLLQQTISVLEKMDCSYICPSHERQFVQPRERIINLLKNIYSKRNKDEAFIYVDYIV